MADITTGLGINIFGTGYTGGAGQTGLIVSVANNALKVDASGFTQPVIGTGVAGTAATGVVTIQGITGMTPVEITGNITAVAGGTQIVTGTVAVTGSVTAIPTGTQVVEGTITTVPSGTQTVTVSGTTTAVVSGIVTAVPTGTQTVDGTVSVTGSVTTIPSGTQTVTVSGTTTAVVSGIVTAVPTGTQIVEGTVGVTGTVTAIPSGTMPVTGTGTAGTNITTGIFTIQGVTTGVAVPVAVKDPLTGTVNDYGQADVAASSSGTVVAKGVASGSFVLKGIQSSSSAGPVKVVVTVSNSTATTTLSVGFFSSASPFVFFDYPQGYVVASGNTVSVVGTNNAISSQTIYSSINGLSV